MRRLKGISFDRFLQPEVRLFGKYRSTFRVCGSAGVALALLLSMILASRAGLSARMMLLLAVSAIFTFLCVAMAGKILTGEERLVCYHQQIAVAGTSALLLQYVGKPVLPYLDITLLGVGLFLSCGRVGCFLVGCCHGLPHRWGVRYHAQHVASGLTPRMAGVPLLPIQLVEAVWVLSLVIVGSALVLTGEQPGAALAWFAVGYGLGRFHFEFLRGDAERPYWAGFSEAQWTSLAIVCLIAAIEARGGLPFHLWHALAAACIGLTMIAVAVRRRTQAR